MAGVSIKPNVPVPPSDGPAPAAPAPAATPATVLPDAPTPTAGTVAGTNDGQTIAMPTVAAPVVPAIGGGDKLNDDGADYEILHHRVGDFSQGDRVKASRFPEGCDFERLIKLEAVKSLKDSAPADETTKKAK